MFIAVINENFEVVEESKKEQQASNYWANHQAHRAQKRSKSWFRRLNPYRWFKANPVKVQVDNLPANLVLPIQKSVIQDYNVPRFDDRSSAVSYCMVYFFSGLISMYSPLSARHDHDTTHRSLSPRLISFFQAKGPMISLSQRGMQRIKQAIVMRQGDICAPFPL